MSASTPPKNGKPAISVPTRLSGNRSVRDLRAGSFVYWMYGTT